MAHLIFVCKYRRCLLIRLGKDVKSIMFDIAEENNFGIKKGKTWKNQFLKNVISTIFPDGNWEKHGDLLQKNFPIVAPKH